MKSLKRIFSAVLVCVLFLSFAPTGANASSDARKEAYTAYYDFMMEELDSIGKTMRDPDYYKICVPGTKNAKVQSILAAYLIDITGDDIGELFIKEYITHDSSNSYDTGDNEWVRIYSYIDGNLKRIGQSCHFVKDLGNGSYTYYEPEGYIGNILSFHDYPHISDDCVLIYKGRNGKYYLADDEPSMMGDHSFTIFGFDGSKMVTEDYFSVLFIPDWQIGDIESDYGRNAYYINNENVDNYTFKYKMNGYISGGGPTRLVNNDYTAVLKILEANADKSFVAHYYTPSAWAVDEVASAESMGYVPESLQKKYKMPITRAEFCALATQYYEKVTGTTITERESFSDTSDLSVQKMGGLGVVNGVGNGKFAPDKLLTRQEAATILARLSSAIGTEFPAGSAVFADNDKIAAWAREGVGKVSEAGIMNGVGNDNFDPLSSYTREQAILTVLRMGGSLAEVESIDIKSSIYFYRVGYTESLAATVYPENASNKNLSWKSSNTDVARVSQYGTVTAVGVGSAVITVTAANGVSASCRVTVENEADYIDITPLIRGSYNCLNYVVHDPNSDYYTCDYYVHPDFSYDYHPSDAMLTGKVSVEDWYIEGSTLCVNVKVESIESGMQYQFFPYLKYIIKDEYGVTVDKGAICYGMYYVGNSRVGYDYDLEIDISSLGDGSYTIEFLNESGLDISSPVFWPEVDIPDLPHVFTYSDGSTYVLDEVNFDTRYTGFDDGEDYRAEIEFIFEFPDGFYDGVMCYTMDWSILDSNGKKVDYGTFYMRDYSMTALADGRYSVVSDNFYLSKDMSYTLAFER